MFVNKVGKAGEATPMLVQVPETAPMGIKASLEQI